MKFIESPKIPNSAPSGGLFSLKSMGGGISQKETKGFTKVLVNGRVVGLDKSKPFQDRMIGEGLVSCNPKNLQISSVALLETVTANLEAGMRLLDMQELSLAKIGGKLSEVALSLNLARQFVDKKDDAQSRFVQAREVIRKLSKTTFDHTVLFSNGPSKPIVVAVPTLDTWEGFSIDRCDISTPGLRSIELGKVIPSAPGLLLDPDSVSLSFDEWRSLCIQNRLQWYLLADRFHQITHFLLDRAHKGEWCFPDFPNCLPDGQLRRPHRNN
jgi:hypothetical protein